MFTDGFFKGNGFIYNINQDRTKVQLLKAFETREDGSTSNFNENAEMTFHSNENEALTFSNRRIMEDEGILYLEKKLNTMTSITQNVETVDGTEGVVKTDSSKCSCVQS